MVKRSVPAGGSAVVTGDQITYTIWVTNVGNIAASGVLISDTIPVGTIYVYGSAVPPPVSGPDPLVWVLPALVPGVPYSVSFTVQVGELTGRGAIRNVGYVGPNPITETNEIVHVFAPTAIRLISLRVTRTLGGVAVGWQTADEQATLGYQIYRSTSGLRTDADLVTNGMIPAAGYGTGASYSWWDANAPTIESCYWLEEIDAGGASAEYGPACAGATPGNAAFLPFIAR